MRATLLLAVLGAVQADVHAYDFTAVSTSTSFPTGHVKISTTGTTQTFTFALTAGVPTACSTAATSSSPIGYCGFGIYPGNSCARYLNGRDTITTSGQFYAGTVTTNPWTTVTSSGAVSGFTGSYQSLVSGTTASGTLSTTFNTGVPEFDLIGKTLIIADENGDPRSCAVIGAEQTLMKLAAVPRVSASNCRNITQITKAIPLGTAKWEQPLFQTTNVYERIEVLRDLPILNDVNCKKSFPNHKTILHSTFVNDKHMNTPKGHPKHGPNFGPHLSPSPPPAGKGTGRRLDEVENLEAA